MKSATELEEVDLAYASALRAIEPRGDKDLLELAGLRHDRATWALRVGRFDEAAELFRTAQLELRSIDHIEEALNSMAGEARSRSRSAKYDEAVKIFEQAISESTGFAIRANLLAGLASCHLLEASERRSPVDLALLDKAVDLYRDSIEASALGQQDHANARLGLARAMGEKGDQAAAMNELDQAAAELAHLGSPTAKVLIEARDVFESGNWRAIAIF